MIPDAWTSTARVTTLLMIAFAFLAQGSALEQTPFALLDCPPECLCDRRPMESAVQNDTTKSQPHVYFETAEPSDSGVTNDDFSVHALCMIGRAAGFEQIEDLLSLDTSVLKIIYTSQTEPCQLNASNLLRFAHLRDLHVQSLQPQLLRFEIDAALPVERLYLEAVDLARREPPNVCDRETPSLADLAHPRPAGGDANGLFDANLYQIVMDEEMDVADADGVTNVLTETFELEIVPYEVYKRDLANTNNVSFYGWNNLTALSIHDCQLESLHPDFLYGLTRLERLSLQHNNLKILPPFAFYGAPGLRLLSLARNRLLEVSYYSLAGLLELRVLDLSANNISKVSELTFPPFPKLHKLDLRQNPIEYVFDSSFAIANMTRTLFIGSDAVGLQIRTPKPFQGLAQMELLEVRNLQAPSLNQYLFRGLRSLRTLRLLQGNIPFVEYDSFAEMKNLTELSASRCSIAAVSMDAFFGVKRLRTIDLSYNLLTELPVGLFDEQLQLLELYLQGNRLTQLPSEFFRRLAPAVQVVRLIENPWQCSCTMLQWRQAATNRLRVSSGASVPSYAYSNKLSPRCSDPAKGIYNRTVYYVVRKNLQCEVHDKNHQLARRITELNRRKHDAILQQRSGGTATRRMVTPYAKATSGTQQRSPLHRQSTFENPIPQHVAEAAGGQHHQHHNHQRPTFSAGMSALKLQKQQRLQEKYANRKRLAAPGPPPAQRITNNDIEY